MLVVVGIFILTFTGGVLGGGKPPPGNTDSLILCPMNEHYTQNNPRCIRTCANRHVPKSNDCKPITGCVCDGDLVRQNPDGTGKCISENKCPPCGNSKSSSLSTSLSSSSSSSTSVIRHGCGGKKRCKDPNAVFKKCPNPCPLTCAQPNPRPCNKMCLESGCECAQGFVLNEVTGRCIRPRDCPRVRRCKDPHAVYKKCRNPCPLTCRHPNPRPCIKRCFESGCECAEGYVFNEITGRCVRPKNCPVRCPKHSHYVRNDNSCPKTCGNRLLPYSDTAGACKPFSGCVCDPGYVRKYDNATGPCISKRKCPRIPTECGINEEPTSCRIICPPQSCESIFTSYYCLPTECEPGCNCIDGYLRDRDGTCIPSEKCFEPDPPLDCNGDLNATLKQCPTPCPKSCDDLTAGDEGCIEICLPDGCECNPGYVLSKKDGGVCIKPEDCPRNSGCNGDPYAVFSECPSACQPDCANPDPNPVCNKMCMPPGCVCKPGYVLTKQGGRCIKRENCPDCYGDRNATYQECPSICPQTCADHGIAKPCVPVCGPNGCVCKSGYVLTEIGGKCILPKDCPTVGCNGDLNATYTECTSACPLTCEDQEPKICPAVCKPPGCQCNEGYVLGKDGKCILPVDCPGCKGDPNAVPHDCPSSCPTTCENRNNKNKNLLCPTVCDPSGCVCKKGYILTKKGGKCVKPENCPAPGCNGDPNAMYSECPTACEPTCDNTDPNQPCILMCMPPGCICKPGFVLDKNGKCIKPENCPVGCNGDRNATYTDCTSACPLTCEDQEPKICPAICKPPGCQCNEGYVLGKDGKCILPVDCPGCKGDPNAVPHDCPSFCPTTCENLNNKDKNVLCPTVCDPSGCVCKKGYILTKKGGKCVKPENCPKPGCNGDPNAEHSECPSACEPTCDNPDPNQPCILMCMPPGCVCKPGFVLNKDGKCIKPENCPVVGCNGDRNATYTECTSACPSRCEDKEPRICAAVCMPPGCQCNEGYVLDKDGKCILPVDCPGCKGDPNAVPNDCPSSCPKTCENRYKKVQCPLTVCDPSGCECKPGYILTKIGGKCIKPENCPEPGCNGDPNAEHKECPSACEPTCTKPDPNQVCNRMCMPAGCVCKKGFVLSEQDGKCVKPENCPVGCNGDRNATYKECLSACPLTCAKPEPGICQAICLPPGCECNPGYVLGTDGNCILPEDCPAEPQCKGDRNATYVECPSACQATCSKPDIDVCTDQCMPPGCVCKHGYLKKKKGGRCIKPEDCPGGSPKCPKNETYVYCKVGCPTNYCPVDDSLAIVACDPMYPCPGGCACKEGYLRLSERNNRCIRSSECPPVKCTRPNEVWAPKTPGCLRESCDDKDIPCDYQYPGPPRCICIKGYYRNRDGICVPESQCPKTTCDDPNATFDECPSQCPATCCNPDSDRPCTTACAEPGCVCNEGFLLSEPGGLCVRPSDCDGGSPKCCNNMTYTGCKIDCPMKYCPTHENEKEVICDPVWPCPKGCVCEAGYLMLNTVDRTCILAADCPTVECTGQNEVWDPKPPKCNLQKCSDMYSTCYDTSPGRPKCVCKGGYWRDQNGDCIPAEECPEPLKCGYNEIEVPCRQICPPQNCEIAYTDYACTDESKICEPRCDCLSDHLRNVSSICIPNDQCPYPSTPVCGINEIARDCRRICPPQSCISKFALFRCKEDIPCEAGCDCVPNYLRDERGICIPSEKCPGPEPLKCGYNEIEVPCRQICPPQNCEIAYTDYACTDESKICEPGCDCLPDHLRNGSGICIPNDQCPYPSTPVCGINEIARDCRRICPPQTCISKYALFNCIADIPCEPGCDCVPNYLRDERGICIPSEKCPGPCLIPEECQRTCEVPNPQNCDYNPPKDNMNQCDCKEGYVLSEIGGDCIPIEDCPPHLTCNGDPNARIKKCPHPCPSTCDAPNATPCKRMCEPIGCECKSGYLLSNSTGRCILPDKCPGGNPCGKNGHFVDCKTDCKRDYCPVDDSRDIVFCDPPAGNCLSGCICNLNHKKKSHEYPICIVSSDCPKVNCTRPNEKWSSCPSACLRENCEDIHDQPTTCNTLVLNCEPACICKKNYFRNSKGICIPAKDCPC